jgi:hypothetical protein
VRRFESQPASPPRSLLAGFFSKRIPGLLRSGAHFELTPAGPSLRVRTKAGTADQWSNLRARSAPRTYDALQQCHRAPQVGGEVAEHDGPSSSRDDAGRNCLSLKGVIAIKLVAAAASTSTLDPARPSTRWYEPRAARKPSALGDRPRGRPSKRAGRLRWPIRNATRPDAGD